MTDWTAAKVAELLEGTLTGDPATPVLGIASVAEADTGDLVFAESEKYLLAALKSKAAAVLVPSVTPDLSDRTAKPLIRVAEPRVGFVRVLEAFSPPSPYMPGIHATAVVAESATVGEGAFIGPHVVIEDGANIGAGVVLLSGVHVGANAVIGAGTTIHPNATLYPGVKIGRRCLLHAGCVIGADGFGFVPVGQSIKKVPHLGTVEIGDEVEIGVNSCIDRAKTGVTSIGSGSKLDNLVHIAHNCRVGMGCLFAAQAGVAGSTTLGNAVIMAGQSGIVDHVSVGDGVRIGAQTAIIGHVPAGQTYIGFPGRPHAQKMREYGALTMLPEALKQIRKLEKRLAELEQKAQEKA